jgi:hypothetical protein
MHQGGALPEAGTHAQVLRGTSGNTRQASRAEAAALGLAIRSGDRRHRTGMHRMSLREPLAVDMLPGATVQWLP